MVGGQILEASRGGEELLASNVRVSADSREAGVAEALGDEARVAEFLSEPDCSRVAKRMSGHVLLEACSLRGSPDDVGEDRLLQTAAAETTYDRVVWSRLACRVEVA